MTRHQLPNLFDQYSQDENRVTNALLQTLAASWLLTKSFLKKFVKLHYDSRKANLSISAQKRPRELGDLDSTEEEVQNRDAIPDGWIVSEDGNWVVVLESKIYLNAVRLNQLEGHVRGIRGGSRVYLLVLTPDELKPRQINKVRRKNSIVRWARWEDIHHWVVRNQIGKNSRAADSLLLPNLREFLEMHENLSGFQGIDFREGYDGHRAKSYLQALTAKIRPRGLKIYPDLTGGRSGITISGSGVWDCFGVEPKFTDDLHFTVGISVDHAGISLTVPNAAAERWKNLERLCTSSAFRDRFQEVIRDVRKQVPELWIRLEQRHFLDRRRSVQDGRLDFSVDTAPFLKRRSGTKHFPAWFEALLQALGNKKGVNLQLQFRAVFAYDNKKTQSTEFADVAVESLSGFKPLYKMLRS